MRFKGYLLVLYSHYLALISHVLLHLKPACEPNIILQISSATCKTVPNKI